MSKKEILESALKLNPADRYLLVDELIRSLDEPDKTLEELWNNEAERRLKAYREGKLQGVQMHQVFQSK